jgi:hypothetical protein
VTSDGFNGNGSPWEKKFFGRPWRSGVVEEGGIQVPTPVGELCLLCEEAVHEHDRGTFMLSAYRPGEPLGYHPVHRECSLRSVIGGIGHLENHTYWCKEKHDPDGGRTFRASALMVWHWVQVRGVPGE